ncbi:hypothetical protein HOY80DRAFT_263512 [Tuber brumale]|nr:hypothetical protein HOY80DRAFT_263512 [Tuber brumale]
MSRDTAMTRALPVIIALSALGNVISATFTNPRGKRRKHSASWLVRYQMTEPTAVRSEAITCQRRDSGQRHYFFIWAFQVVLSCGTQLVTRTLSSQNYSFAPVLGFLIILLFLSPSVILSVHRRGYPVFPGQPVPLPPHTSHPIFSFPIPPSPTPSLRLFLQEAVSLPPCRLLYSMYSLLFGRSSQQRVFSTGHCSQWCFPGSLGTMSKLIRGLLTMAQRAV